MRLFRPAAIVFVIASALALAALVFATSISAQERTPEWLFEHGHIGEARAVAERLIAANPRDASALAWLARTQTLSGDLKRAIATADPKSVMAQLALAEALGDEAENASVFRQLGLARRVRKALETAVALNPSNLDALSGMMQYYVRAPGVVGGSGEKAHATAAKMTTLDPARGYIAQASIASRKKQADKVEGLFLKAFEANPKSVHARMALANFYAGRPAKQAEAETHAKALLAMDLSQADTQHPSNLLSYLSAAQVLRVAGSDPQRAERYLKRYLSQPPEIGMPAHAVAERELKLLLSNKRPVAELLHRAAQLVLGVHDDRAMPRDGLFERLA